jgi:O-antigen chain-terminating methyltransferase
MTDTANTATNVEDLMKRVRSEVALQKIRSEKATGTDSGTRFNDLDGLPIYPNTPVSLPRLPRSDSYVPDKPGYVLADFLVYHDVEFVRSAYRGLLRREPDANGFAHHLELLRSGQLNKAEILSALRYSTEGKACGVKVLGLLRPPLLLTVARIPLVRFAVRLFNFIVGMPAIFRNRERFERDTVRWQHDQSARINVLASQIEIAIGQAQLALAERDSRLDHRIQQLFCLKSTVDGVSRELAAKAGKAEIDVLATNLAEMTNHVEKSMTKKATLAQVGALENRIVEKILSLSKGLERKADSERLTQLTNHLVDLVQSKADSAILAETVTRFDDSLARKATVALVEELARRIEEESFSLSRELETKADNERLTQHLSDLEQSKTEVANLASAVTRFEESLAQRAKIAQVEELARRIEEESFSLSRELETKADNERLTQHLSDLEQSKTEVANLASAVTRFEESLAQRAKIAQVEELARRTEEDIFSLTRGLEGKAEEEQMKAFAAHTKADAVTIQQAAMEIRQQIFDLQHDILDQKRRLAKLFEEIRNHLPEATSIEQVQELMAEEDRLLDAFYASFEDQFRGSREDIKQRVSVYLPVVKEVKAGTKRAPILDIGCGRGEWLELLRENDLVASGVDMNRVMISRCKDLGLEVAEADAIAYLGNLKANSLGAVTGIHIIEHIPFKRLVALFDEALRVLKPGGVAIFETPNPENLSVGAFSFYYDPTHLNPLPPEPMRFVMAARGFRRIEIMRLHPKPESSWLKEGAAQVQQIVNDLMFGALDYSLVAYKA